MKKRMLPMVFSILVCLGAHADELSDAIAMHQKREYPQAMQVFSKLANAGNTQAQEQLADMYWFGDGMPVDLIQAERWFTTAAQAGGQKAQQSLVVMRARVTRRDEIAYFTTRFDGAKLKFSNSGCVQPAVPAVSKTNAEINQVSGSIEQWSECYNQYVSRLRAALPVTSAIPKDLMDIMSDDDLAHATVLMDKSLLTNAEEAKQIAARVSADIEGWKRETESFVAVANAKKSGMSPAEYELFQASRQSVIGTQRSDRAMGGTPAEKAKK